jgi:hypothetical protein
MVTATPSSTVFTNCTLDLQSYKLWHITYDSYFTVGKEGAEKGDFATDVGLTVGILPFEKFQLEVGFDWLEPTDDPLFFNFKAGAPENALCANCPALQFGMFNIGIEENVTDYNVAQLIIGKTLPQNLGRLSGSLYKGSDTLVSSVGEVEDSGFMLAYDKGFYPVNDAEGEYNRFVFAADYASGDNAIGGGGAGLYIYFTRKIDLLVGPVWFNDEGINGGWKWTVQLDVNF